MANTNTMLRLQKVYCSPGIVSIFKKTSHTKNPATKQDTWNPMATLTGKEGIIHDCQMLTSRRPNFYRALGTMIVPLAPTQPSLVVWCLP